MSKYFLISVFALNGEWRIEEVDPNKLTREIVEGDRDDAEFCDKLPAEYTNDWPEGSVLLIKGEIVVPTITRTITRADIP